MHPISSKRAQSNITLVSSSTPASSNYNYHQSSSSKLLSNFSLLPLFSLFFLFNQPRLYQQSSGLEKVSKQRPLQQSFLINLEKISHPLSAAYCKVKKENQAKTRLTDENFKIKDTSDDSNIDLSENSNLNNLSSKDDNPKEEAQAFWINIGNTSNSKKKLMRILVSDLTIPKQC